MTPNSVELEMRVVPGAAFAEYFITGLCRGVPSDEQAARRLFSRLARLLQAKRIELLQEKIYGAPDAWEEILRARRASYRARGLDAEFPHSRVVVEPVDRGICSLQAWGVSPVGRRRAGVRTVQCLGGGPGRLWEGDGFRFLYVPSVASEISAVRAGAVEGAALRAKRMFCDAERRLDSHGFSFSRVVRTWIYLRDIPRWYAQFNQVRNGFYRSRGRFGRAAHPAFPASTGVQAAGGSCCAMDLLAFSGAAGKTRSAPIIKTPLQGEALAYGSAFSRGVLLDVAGRKTIHVSGTASIDAAGNNVHPRDPEAQSVETLRNVEAVLCGGGLGLENICSATLFCKNRVAHEAFSRATRKLGIPRFPMVSVLTELCRPELQVELEAVAA